MKQSLSIAFFLVLFCSTLRADERIPIEATINGKPVKLVFDTGATDMFLFAPAVRKLDLKSAPPPTTVRAEGLRVEITEPVTLKIFSLSREARFYVVDLGNGPPPDVDGAIGWGPLRENVCAFDSKTLKLSISSEVPEAAKLWLKYPLRPKTRDLSIDLPGPEGKRKFILIDTGSDSGVSLGPARWKQWRAENPKTRKSISAVGTAYQSVVIREEHWASKLEFGALELTDVPVQEATEREAQTEGYEATFGLWVLRRLNLVVDGGNGWAYLRPSSDPPPPFVHNRLGAVFVPTKKGSDDLIASVAEGTPAHRAGIRDGDVLLKVDALDVSRWRTDPSIGRPNRSWERPAGTWLTLTLRREQKEYQATVELEELLKPS